MKLVRKNRKLFKPTIRFASSSSSSSSSSLVLVKCYKTRQGNRTISNIMDGSSNTSMPSISEPLNVHRDKPLSIDFEGVNNAKAKVISQVDPSYSQLSGKIVTQSDTVNAVKDKLTLIKKISYNKLDNTAINNKLIKASARSSDTQIQVSEIRETKLTREYNSNAFGSNSSSSSSSGNLSFDGNNNSNTNIVAVGDNNATGVDAIQRVSYEVSVQDTEMRDVSPVDTSNNSVSDLSDTSMDSVPSMEGSFDYMNYRID